MWLSKLLTIITEPLASVTPAQRMRNKRKQNSTFSTKYNLIILKILNEKKFDTLHIFYCIITKSCCQCTQTN